MTAGSERSGSRDPLEAAGGRLEAVTLETTLNAILRAHPTAVVLALDDRAVRVPLPDDDRFATCHELPEPDRTVMDFVEPQDRMAVVTCWERARSVGLGRDRVRLSHATEAHHTLTIIDCRARHGVWIELLVPEPDLRGSSPAPAEPVRLPAPSRPRTAVMHKNLSAVIVAVDDRTSALLGWAEDDLVGRRSLDFIHPEDHQRSIAAWLELRSRRAVQRVRVRHRRRDGTWLWVEIENEYLGTDDPDGEFAVARVIDVSEEMAAVEALRAQEALFRRLTESLPVGVVQIDRMWRVVYTNARLQALFGAGPAAAWPDLVDHLERADRARLEQAIARALAGGTDEQLEATVVLPGDPPVRRYLFTLVGTPALDGPEADGVLVSVTDVTESARLRERLRVQATRDPLTGCLNRAAVLTAVDEILAGPAAGGAAVVFLDLDGFKTVNDTAGHAAGDELLRHIGARLVAFAGDEERVGRLGGDEFLVLLTDLVDADAGSAVARELGDRLSAPVELPAGRFTVHASLGVAHARPGMSAEAVVAQADQAMYRTKQVRGTTGVRVP